MSRAYELGLGAVTGKLAGALGTGARAGRNARAGKANLLEQSTWGLADNAFTLGENAASYGMKRGLDLLAGQEGTWKDIHDLRKKVSRKP
ncbi:MAG: hypothetical protein HQL36_01675 [Alphaproteobacteria bacterium]|nr:hypothetical protein [Alphaproteobacteria bacterium]